MCELLGVCAKRPVVVQEYLKSFYSHSVKHPHGWGIMCETDVNKQDIVKEPVCASGSRIISELIRKTKSQTNPLAHIRYATIGATKYCNCHPYTGIDASGRRWTLIHNGTIYSGTQLAKYLIEQAGGTDSERIFLFLLNEINKEYIRKQTPLPIIDRCHIVDTIAVSLAPRNRLNFMVFDGEILYVHKNMKNTLVYKETDNGFVFSTQPLDSESWTQFPMTQMHAYKNGECVFKGTDHGYKFIPTLDYITALDAMNI